MDLIFEPRKRRPFIMEVGYFDTVREIKHKVEKYQGISFSDQTLVFKGQRLPDTGDIASCVLLHNSRINLIIASDEKTLRLHVKIPAPNAHILTLEIDVNHTVLHLKDKILKLEATLRAANRPLMLRFNGQELQDSRSLSECEVPDGAEIDVSFRPSISSSKRTLIKVILQSKCESKRMAVDVNPSDKVEELRKECQRLNQEMGFPLPKEYFFIHRQAVMDDDRSFRWHHVCQGDTIEVFNGSVISGS